MDNIDPLSDDLKRQLAEHGTPILIDIARVKAVKQLLLRYTQKLPLWVEYIPSTKWRPTANGEREKLHLLALMLSSACFYAQGLFAHYGYTATMDAIEDSKLLFLEIIERWNRTTQILTYGKQAIIHYPRKRIFEQFQTVHIPAHHLQYYDNTIAAISHFNQQYVEIAMIANNVKHSVSENNKINQTYLFTYLSEVANPAFAFYFCTKHEEAIQNWQAILKTGIIRELKKVSIQGNVKKIIWKNSSLPKRISDELHSALLNAVLANTGLKIQYLIKDLITLIENATISSTKQAAILFARVMGLISGVVKSIRTRRQLQFDSNILRPIECRYYKGSAKAVYDDSALNKGIGMLLSVVYMTSPAAIALKISPEFEKFLIAYKKQEKIT